MGTSSHSKLASPQFPSRPFDPISKKKSCFQQSLLLPAAAVAAAATIPVPPLLLSSAVACPTTTTNNNNNNTNDRDKETTTKHKPNDKQQWNFMASLVTTMSTTTKNTMTTSTTLHCLILRQDWQRVLIRANLYPQELQLVVRVHLYGIDLEVLPLHLVCALDPPAIVVQVFLNHYVDATSQTLRPATIISTTTTTTGGRHDHHVQSTRHGSHDRSDDSVRKFQKMREKLYEKFRRWRENRKGSFPTLEEKHVMSSGDDSIPLGATKRCKDCFLFLDEGDEDSELSNEQAQQRKTPVLRSKGQQPRRDHSPAAVLGAESVDYYGDDDDDDDDDDGGGGEPERLGIFGNCEYDHDDRQNNDSSSLSSARSSFLASPTRHNCVYQESCFGKEEADHGDLDSVHNNKKKRNDEVTKKPVVILQLSPSGGIAPMSMFCSSSFSSSSLSSSHETESTASSMGSEENQKDQALCYANPSSSSSSSSLSSGSREKEDDDNDLHNRNKHALKKTDYILQLNASGGLAPMAISTSQETESTSDVSSTRQLGALEDHEPDESGNASEDQHLPPPQKSPSDRLDPILQSTSHGSDKTDESLFRIEWDLFPILQEIVTLGGALLPLHIACIFEASAQVLDHLIRAYPCGCRSHVFGMLPIHLVSAGWTLPVITELPPEAKLAIPIDTEKPGPAESLKVLCQSGVDAVNQRSRSHGMTPRDYIEECMEDGEYKDICLNILSKKADDGNKTAQPNDDGYSGRGEVRKESVVMNRDPNHGSPVTPAIPKHRSLMAGLCDSIVSKDWNRAVELVEDDPTTAQKWYYGVDEEEPILSGSIWKRLPVHLACIHNAPIGLIDILLQCYPIGAAIQDPQDGSLPLHMLCKACATLPVVKRLVMTCPAATKAVDINGRSALHMAVIHEASLHVVRYLLLVDPEMVVVTDQSGMSPLDYAMETGDNMEITELLTATLKHLDKESDL